MDAELWAARLAAAKRQHSIYRTQPESDRINIDDFEIEDDSRPYFPCPYCYEEYDIASLFSHLEEKHPFESEAARRRRLRRVAVPNSSTLSSLSRDYREAHLQVLLGSGAFRSSNNTTSSVADNYLSSLVLNVPGSEVEEVTKSSVSAIDASSAKLPTINQKWKPCEPTLSSEERAQKIKQQFLRANFVQQLVVSTLLDDE